MFLLLHEFLRDMLWLVGRSVMLLLLHRLDLLRRASLDRERRMSRVHTR
jgi:hypothetical protein